MNPNCSNVTLIINRQDQMKLFRLCDWQGMRHGIHFNLLMESNSDRRAQTVGINSLRDKPATDEIRNDKGKLQGNFEYVKFIAPRSNAYDYTYKGYRVLQPITTITKLSNQSRNSIFKRVLLWWHVRHTCWLITARKYVSIHNAISDEILELY